MGHQLSEDARIPVLAASGTSMLEPGRQDHVQGTQRPTQFPTQSHHRELQAHKAGAIMCLFHEKQILRLLQAYAVYFNQARPHQGIERAFACLFSSFLIDAPFHEGKMGDESDCTGATLRYWKQMSQVASTTEKTAGTHRYRDDG